MGTGAFIFLIQSTYAQKEISRSAVEEQSYDKEFVETLKNEVLESFTLMGQPITPKAFKEMEQWISDMIPSIIAIDLLATINSNQFFGDFTSEKKRNVTWHNFENKEDNGFFKYAFIGKIGRDKCVMATVSNGGGSLTVASLIILKIEIDNCLDVSPTQAHADKLDSPVPRYRVIAKQVADLRLSAVGDFELKDDILTIKTEDLERTQIIDLSKFTEL